MAKGKTKQADAGKRTRRCEVKFTEDEWSRVILLAERRGQQVAALLRGFALEAAAEVQS